jgi:HYR domain
MRRLLSSAAAIALFGALASATFGSSADAPPITIGVPSSVEATDPAGADVSYHVTSHLDLNVTCTPTGGPDTDFTATSHFPVGDSTISCSDSEGNLASDTAHVVDTTPPTVTVPPGAKGATTDPSGTSVATWDPPTASDLVDGSVEVSCNHASGDSFPIGNTLVTCTATDSHNNTGSASFTVTVTYTDQTPPTIDPHDNITTEATSGSGAVVTFSVTAHDESGTPPTVSCAPGSGSTFSITTTAVTCTATDAANNTATTSFSVTVRDTTKPTLNLPSNITAEADSSAGKTVTYSATASDLVSSSLSPNCSPASGGIFPIGTTTVNCTVSDGAGNTANGSFTVTVSDASGPAFTSVPGTVTVEANGPSGSIVNYQAPTAVDTVDGPQLVSCAPATHTLFPIGSTTVQCSASDNHGNSSSASFQVAVVDTTPPTLAVPGPTSVYATTPTGIPETEEGLIRFRAAATADDIVDPHPLLSDNLGSFAEVGTHDVDFVARDASGNATAKATQLTVLPMPPEGTPPLPVPPSAKLPADVPSLQVIPGDGFVRLVWGAVPGVARYLVYRSESGPRRLTAVGHGDLVYSGTATTYTDRGLTNGVEYRYVLVTQDAAGNESAGVGSAAVPRLNLLRTPKDGAKLKKPPKLTWARNAEANYYNVQVFRGQAKILSTWPVGASLKLKRTWKYEGRRYTLTKGVYRWYVWPGFGARSAVDYGELLGSNSFQMTR